MLIKHVSLVTLTLLLATPVSARILGTDLAATNSTNSSTWIELAQTRTKENRDARQDDRQGDRDDRLDTRGGCREAEGVGKDKRDCKQDGRQDERQD
jgi:hypothetical protein